LRSSAFPRQEFDWRNDEVAVGSDLTGRRRQDPSTSRGVV